MTDFRMTMIKIRMFDDVDVDNNDVDPDDDDDERDHETRSRKGTRRRTPAPTRSVPIKERVDVEMVQKERRPRDGDFLRNVGTTEKEGGSEK